MGFEGISSGRRRVLVTALAICILPWSALVAAPAPPAHAATTAADLSLNAGSDLDVVAVGDDFTLTLTLTNDGPDEAGGVLVTGSLPVDWIFVSAVPAADYDDASGVWDVGPVTSGESKVLQIVATMNGQGTVFYNAQVTASGADDPDSTPGNAPSGEDDEAFVGVTGALEADLELDKAVDNAAPTVSSNVTFTLTLSNDGPSDVSGVGVRDLLPSNMTFVSATPADYDSSTGIWNAPPVAIGASASIDIVVSVDNDVATANCAEIWISPYIDHDSIRGNNSTNEDDDDCVAVAGQPRPIADLSLSAAGTPSIHVTVGGPAGVQLIIRNDGPDSATDVVVRDNLASLPDFVFDSAQSAESGADYDAATGTWDVGTLASGATEILELFLTVTAAGEPQYQVEIIQSSAADPDSTPANFWTAEDDEAVVNFLARGTSSDLSLDKAVDEPNPVVGSNVTFTLTVTNDGPHTVLGITVSDLLPTGLTFVSAAPPLNTDYDNTTGLWAAGNLGNGDSAVLEIVAMVTGTSPVSNYAEIATADLSDPNSTPGNNSTNEDDDDTVIVTGQSPSADLSLSKTVDDATPPAGSDVTFTLTISNDGPDAATGVEVTDVLPAGLAFVSANPATAYDESTGIWSVGSVPSGASVGVEILATVIGTAPVHNTASVTATDQPDPNSSNDSATVTVTGQAADLSLAKAVDDPTPSVGTNVTFTLTVTNGGNELATGVAVTDLLPTGLTFVSADPSTSYEETTGVWTVGNLAGGAAVDLVIVATVTGTAAVVNRAEVTASDQADPDSTPGNGGTTDEDDEASVTVTGQLIADLSLAMTVNDDTPPAGLADLFFTLTVTNAGPNPTTGVVVTAILPNGYDSYGADDAGTYDTSTDVWTVGNLAPSATATVFVSVRVPGTPFVPATIYAEVTASDRADPDSTPGNASANEDDDDSVTVTPVPPLADLSVAMSVDDASPDLGDQVGFTVTVSNHGPDLATDVIVLTLLPTGLTYVDDDSPTSGPPFWAVGELPSGISRTLRVYAIVDATQALVPYGEVWSSGADDPDSTPGNGSITEDDYASVTIVANSQFADLSLTMSVDDPTPFVGNNVTISLTLVNDGPQDVASAFVVSQLPAGLTYVSDDGGGAYNPTGVWAITGLPASTSASLQITAKVTGTAPVRNDAEVTASSRLDPDSTPNNASTTEDDDASVTVTGQPISDISLTMSADTDIQAFGSNVVFTITVTNVGPSATDIAVSHQLPNGLEFLSSSGGGVYHGGGLWTVDDLAASSSVTLQVTARVNGLGSLTSYAEVTFSSNPDPDSTPNNHTSDEDDDASVTVTGQPLTDLSLTKTVNDTMPTVGGMVRFTLTVSNAGPHDAIGVLVKDLLPVGLLYVSDTSPNQTYNPATGIWTVGNVFSGSGQTLEIVATVTGTTPVDNAAEVWASVFFDPDSTPGDGSTTDDDDATATVTGQPLVDLALDKSVSDTTPAIGVNFTFTLTLSNEDTDRATGVEVLDFLPSDLRLVSVNASQGSVFSIGTVLRWTVGTVGAGSSATLTLTVKHRGGTLAPLTNYAEISQADQDDPDSILNNRSATEDDDDSVTLVPETPRCAGIAANRIGTIDDDTNATLPSSGGPDIVVLFAGNDVWDGGGGNDIVCAGDGNDVIHGDTGNDTLFGESGDDQLTAGAGMDTLRGGDGNDGLLGQDGNDTLTGEAGDDSLDGGIGNDSGRGGNGNDTLLGDAGNDQLYGEVGNDGFNGGPGTDDCSGGAGTDFFIGGTPGGCERPAAIP